MSNPDWSEQGYHPPVTDSTWAVRSELAEKTGVDPGVTRLNEATR